MTNTTHTHHSISFNHNETVVTDRRVPRALAFNHNEIVVTEPRVSRAVTYNHNETVVVSSRARLRASWLPPALSGAAIAQGWHGHPLGALAGGASRRILSS